MKTLLLLLAVIVTVAMLYTRDQNAKTRAHSEAMLAEMRTTSAAPSELPPARPRRKISYVPGVGGGEGHYVEHDADVSAMQSLGGGGGGTAAAPTPALSRSDRETRKQWGWDQKGTSLDQRPR